MNRRAAALAAIAFLVLAAYAIVRAIRHEQGVQPAIVTPAMDAQQEISPSIAGRLKRFFRERVTYGDRSGRPKLIALTFDDGPYPLYTPLLLDELRTLGVPATFFLIGRDAQQWPELAQRISQFGNEIGDHTYTHPNLDAESDGAVRGEIVDGARALAAIVRAPAVYRFFRPPHGRYTVATIRVAQGLGYDTILWNDDP
ncbi:MAG TPA: polysaccharide deacetylase family protein, partial [Candidatus Baltobacteraceae bacterium]|nr:polysaccharide deacetylase family protein [Candidatus Baltobacteraceae bacterium]